MSDNYAMCEQVIALFASYKVLVAYIAKCNHNTVILQKIYNFLCLKNKHIENMLSIQLCVDRVL